MWCAEFLEAFEALFQSFAESDGLLVDGDRAGQGGVASELVNLGAHCLKCCAVDLLTGTWAELRFRLASLFERLKLFFCQLIFRKIREDEPTSAVAPDTRLNFAFESISDAFERARDGVGARAEALADDQGGQVSLGVGERVQLVALQIVVDLVVELDFFRARHELDGQW